MHASSYDSPPAITASVISAFRNGEMWAFNEIFTAYDDRLMGYAASICITRQDAEEVVQDVFMSLWQHRSSIEGLDISGWLITVCRNKSLKSSRRRIFQTEISTASDITSVQPDPLEVLYLAEIEAYLQQVIQTLPPARKMIFLMHREKDMSYQQIADELGISVFTVKKQMSLALQHLRGTVTPYAYSIAVLQLMRMLN